MYQARLHPEQYSNTFSDEQIKQLHDAIMYVCDTAVELNAESDRFPEDWLMKHRWSKGKKDGGKLPSGEKIQFLTVGGRTSAIVPSRQKKTGAVAGDVSAVSGVDEDDVEETKPKAKGKRKSKAVKEEEAEDEDEEEEAPKKRQRTKAEKTKPKLKDESDGEKALVTKKQKAANGAAKKGKTQEAVVNGDAASGRRRSGRLGK